MTRKRRSAGLWEDIGKDRTSQEVSPDNGEMEKEKPPVFKNNDTQDLLRLYRALMTVSRNGPLTSKPARLLIELIQELLRRGEQL